MAGQDGDGWARCGQGHRHWGRFGAVGLLVSLAPAGGSGERVLLAERSWWSHLGGTWGPPGGARDSDEEPAAAALREAAEECGLAAAEVTIGGVLLDDHGGWSYQTFVARATGQPRVWAASAEITEVRWVPVAGVTELPLHPGFAATWPVLAAALPPVTVVVDVANVMGARPDGWWRDRAGAAVRLHGEVAALAGRGLDGLPGLPELPALTCWYPEFVFVVEGAARRATFPAAPRVHVVAAPGSGDDAIVAEAAGRPGRRLVVTADRELRRRCQAAGASVTGPGWLLGLL